MDDEATKIPIVGGCEGEALKGIVMYMIGTLNMHFALMHDTEELREKLIALAAACSVITGNEYNIAQAVMTGGVEGHA